MARIDLTSAGVTFSYAAGADSKPSSFTKIDGVKSIPELNPEPNALETTTLDETEYKTYVPGLKDTGGAISFGFNLTQSFITAWDAVMEAYGTGSSAKPLWFEIKIPGITKKFYFQGVPSPLGLSSIEPNAVLEIDVYITVSSQPQWIA